MSQQAIESVFHLAAESTVSMHTVSVGHGVVQLYKQQDFTATGAGVDVETNESFTWTLLNDGHGSNTIIDKIRDMIAVQDPLSPTFFMNQPNPCAALQDKLCQVKLGHEESGATGILTKIYKNRGVVYSVGDSFATVLKNGAPIWRNTLHKWENLEERARLLELNPRIQVENSSSIKVLSSDTMCRANASYIKFPYFGNIYKKLAPSQAFGHDNMTGIAPDTFTFEIEPGQEYKIIKTSDGCSDMFIENGEDMPAIYGMSHEEILHYFEAKWKQEWYPVWEDKPTIKFQASRFTKPSEMDDLSCIVVKIEPIV
jgi:serine/threonine protein phosphatase PrpC